MYLVGGDDRFETNAPSWQHFETADEVDERLRWSDQFYHVPVCRKCKCSNGRRTSKQLTLRYAPGRFDGAFGYVGTEAGSCHQIVSAEFLALLSKRERQRLELQETIRRGRRKFYELLGPDGQPFVAVAGRKPQGWRCTQCGHRTWSYWLNGTTIHSFVARCDLPARLGGIFTVGRSPEVQLAATALRWRALVGQKGTRGFTSNLLGVVPDSELVRCPKLPPLDK